MKIHRFICSVDLPASGGLTLAGEAARQMKVVLKIRPGEEVAICDGQGREARAVVHEYLDDAVVLRVAELYSLPAEKQKVFLYASLLKNDNFELLCEKCTEVGVSAIIPIFCERTIKGGVRTERIGKILREAAETSGRGVVPELLPSVTFVEGLHAAPGVKLFYDTDIPNPRIPSVPTLSARSVFIGPEGGWTDNERKLAEKANCVFRSLLPRPLRAETAAILSIYDALHL